MSPDGAGHQSGARARGSRSHELPGEWGSTTTADEALEAQAPALPLALVLGAEGKGLQTPDTGELRPDLPPEHVPARSQSLNVSNAAAVAPCITVRPLAAGPRSERTDTRSMRLVARAGTCRGRLAGLLGRVSGLP